MDDLREREQIINLTEEQLVEMRRQEVSNSTSISRQTDQVNPPARPALIDAEGLQKTLQGLTNMALAHEIARNKDFKLTKPERTFEEPMSQEVQRALEAKEKYWEKVDQILTEKNIKEAKNTILDLIHTLRTMLQSTMLPHNVKLRLKIDQELDMHKVSNEIENDAFDFVYYMNFIVDTLSMLCCPIRDKEIVEIRKIDVPSLQVRKTIDLMENMNLDMANFIISQSRQHIVQNCVTYERNKFASYVELQYKMGKDPINVTRAWILRHATLGRTFSETMAFAFLEILEWSEEKWPETLTLDWGRFPAIRAEIRRVTIIGAMVAAVFDYARTLLLDLPEDASDFEKSKEILMKNYRLLNKLREELNLLITCEEVADPRKFHEALERCCIQAVRVVDQHHIAEKYQGITSVQKENITGMIRPLVDLNHPVRLLYLRRVKDWFAEVAKEDGKGRAQAPPNLSIVGPLILVPITEMLRIAMFNREVYDVVYQEIFDGNCPPPTFYPSSAPKDTDSDGASKFCPNLHEGIVNILMKLQGFTDESMVYEKFRTESLQNLPANETTLEKDYEGVHIFHAGDPDWMLDYTTEQLLKLMERENIIDANKLRRVKERLEKIVLEECFANNLPTFEKVWKEEVGTFYNEFARLQEIMQQKSTAARATPSAVTNAKVEPKEKRIFLGACELKNPTASQERPRSQSSQVETSSPTKETQDADHSQFSPGVQLNQSNASEN